jgi:hypothetical protein
MRETAPDLPLDAVVLDDARTGQRLDLGRSTGVQVITLIRHRH